MAVGGAAVVFDPDPLAVGNHKKRIIEFAWFFEHLRAEPSFGLNRWHGKNRIDHGLCFGAEWPGARADCDHHRDYEAGNDCCPFASWSHGFPLSRFGAGAATYRAAHRSTTPWSFSIPIQRRYYCL